MRRVFENIINDANYFINRFLQLRNNWILLAVLFHSINLFAQSNTRFAGNVFDSDTEQPLSGAVVEVIEMNIFVSTDNRGFFEFQNLQPGTYTISVSYLGYKEIRLKNIVVHIDQVNQIMIELDPSPLKSDSVIVIADVSREMRNIPLDRFVIPSQEIEIYRNSGLPQLLQQIPGIQIDRTRGGSASYLVRIHGGQAKHVLVLLDGQRLNNPQTGEIDLNLIPFENISEIEIFTYGSSAYHGVGAFDGVINFKTEVLQNAKSAEIKTSVGSFSSASGLMTFHIASSRLGFTGTYQQDYSRQNFTYSYEGESYTRENAWYQNRAIYSKLNYHQNAHTVSINYNFSEEYRGLPSAFYNEMGHYDATASSTYHTVFVNHRWLASDQFFLENQIGYHAIQQNFKNENQPKLNYNDQSINSNSEINARANILFNSDLQGHFGFTYLREYLSAENLINPAQSIGKQSRETIAVFSGIEWQIPYLVAIAKSANIQAALRFEESFAFDPELYPLTGLTLVPKYLSLLSITGNWGKTVRYPDFNSLFWKGDARAHGNPDLLPERKTFWNLITRIDRFSDFVPKIYFRYFSENIRGLIFWQWTPPNIWQPRNEEMVVKNGFDVQLDQEIIKKSLSAKIAYNYTDAINKDEQPNYLNRKIIFIPAHSMNMSVTGHYGGMNLIFNYRFVSERQVTKANTGAPLKDYQILDLSINRVLNLNFLNGEIGLNVRNLFNEDYQLIRGYPMPGREIYLLLTLRNKP